MAAADLDRARDALFAIDPSMPRDAWVRAGMAAQAAGLDFDDFDQWSAQGGNYSERAARDVWRSFKPGKGVGEATLFHMARDAGWTDDGKPRTPSPTKAPIRAVEPRTKPVDGMAAADVWARCEPATAAHPYIVKKGACGVPLDRLRVLPADEALRIRGERMGGSLALPAYGPDGGLQSLQLIPPAGPKMNLPGCPMAGASFVVGDGDGPLYLCEGIGAAWSVWQASGHRAVVCFGWGNVRRIAEQLRQKEPHVQMVLCPDRGKESEAEAIARDLGAAVARLPDGEPSNFDANDYAQREGLDALALLLDDAREPEPPPLPLSVAFADELPGTFEPPDELVQGLLTAGDGSVLYGDSNSGKTFFCIDVAAAVARGVPWMGRQTEAGLVVYLAAESPASVRSRLQAYQRHHGCRVPNFAIVQTPLDLFSSEADTDKVIALVRQLEARRGQKARLIIGDTLARLSAGANENAGQDMGLVVRRFDRIRSECAAHFLLIHHSGKAAANGARGWSGIRAAVDTEIEVTDSPQGRCAEITKQRDLSTKGERIGFRLEPVTLGVTKWGTAATSCVVQPGDAPDRPQARRVSEVGGAVMEHLRTQSAGVKKRALVEHFADLYDKSAVYRELKKLVTAGVVHETAGIVAAHSGVRIGAN